MNSSRRTVKIFNYIEELDAFTVTSEYQKIANTLGLNEWNPVVWIGRYFLLDNDFGEHWFDNWELRAEKAEKAAVLGLDSIDLFIIDPERFQNGRDGPLHSPEQRKQFWTDVLISLELSYELLCNEARLYNAKVKKILPEDSIEDLEYRINRLLSEDL
ncbi:hypothetical protein [Gloeothece verrucosa]|uniref:Uncharacterized protein n=1 Tax=Gloeothece verrucosa (strain PCC 7822) TaxID=497965 RepID=E0UNY0_GLOV7|nr:hypothetical protein [Gloeothece verrucosa]ADN18660.1 hypothetical protein Cyan7822_6648 [Gloeothece verrucosa PCC 7822]